jgi:putative transposase
MWCPKRRRTVLVGPLRARLEHMIRAVAEAYDRTVSEVAIQPDHVHLFLRANPYTLPAEMPRRITGRSLHSLREEFPRCSRCRRCGHARSSSARREECLSTAGNVRNVSQDTLRQYSERQNRT